MQIRKIEMSQEMDQEYKYYDNPFWRSRFESSPEIDLDIQMSVTQEEMNKISEIESGLETGQFTQILDMLVDYLYDLKKESDEKKRREEEVMRKVREDAARIRQIKEETGETPLETACRKALEQAKEKYGSAN